MKRLLLITILIASLSPSRAALNPQLVPSDARWLLYADLTAMHESAVGRELLAVLEPLLPDSTALNQPGIRSIRALATAVMVQGVSFSPNGEPGDGVLLVEGLKARRVTEAEVALSAEQPDGLYYKRTDFPFPTYAVKNPLKAGASTSAPDDPELLIAFPPEPVVLVSKSRVRLLQSARLLSHRGPSLATRTDAPLRPFLPAAANAYLFGASVKTGALTAPGTDAGSNDLLSSIRSGCLAFGEVGANTQARLDLLTRWQHPSKKLLQTLQGLGALASSSSASPAMARAFLQVATITEHDGMISMRASCPNDTLLKAPERVPASQP